MATLDTALDEIEALVRAGRASDARTVLRRLFGRRIPRPQLLRFANLARRAELSDLALKVLNPVVRPSRRRPESATDAERAEYGASLIRLGAIDEGLRLLETLDPAANADILLFRAFGLVARWAYAESIDVLTAYLRSKGLSAYQILIGRMNLCAAFVTERRRGEAEALVAELIDETKRDGHRLLHAKALQLGAQAAIDQREWRAAERLLREARALLTGAAPLERLFLAKWEAIVARLESPGSRAPRDALRGVRAEAARLRHWESVRQCDAYEAMASRDRALALEVYFGTPFESFREKFASDLQLHPGLPAHYLWRVGKPGRHVIDVATGESLARGARLKEGMALHRLLQALSRDFYRAQRVASLHHVLHPDEYFHPLTSPGRVQRVVRRLRDWIRAHAPTLRLEVGPGGYWLEPRGIALRVPRETPQQDRIALRLARLRRTFSDRAFTAAEAGSALDVTPRAALGVLRAGEERGRLTRAGRARATTYRFAGAE